MKKVVDAFAFMNDSSKGENIPGLPHVIQKDTTSSNVNLLVDIASGRVEPAPMRWGGEANPRVQGLMKVLYAQREANKDTK